MKARILLYFSLCTIHYSLCNAQTWEPVGGGIVCNDSDYFTGWCLESADDVIHSCVYTLCVYNDKLYAGGLFKKAGDLKANNIASWNGDRWDSLGAGVNGWVTALAIHDNLLNVGGVFSRAGGKYAKNIAKWVDTVNTMPHWYYYSKGVYRVWRDKWSDTAGWQHYYEAYAINAITDYKGNTYIGGNFMYSPDEGVSVLAFWDSKKTAWSAVKGSVPGSANLDDVSLPDHGYASLVYCLTVHKDKLYITSRPESTQRMFTWDGTVFKDISPGFPKIFSDITCTAESDSGLYFGGHGADMIGVKQSGIVRLNNDGSYKTIYGLPSDARVYCMAYYDNKVYIGGEFDSAGGKPVNNIAMWDGTSWHALGAGLSKKEGQVPLAVYCLSIYKGYLYAGGRFDHSGNKPIENIARWKLN